MSNISVRTKIWLEIDGQPFLGVGRARLLRKIEMTGSLNAACRELGFSYRKGWSQIEAMEQLASFPILVRHKGGKGGGGTCLTDQTLALLKQFESLVKGAGKPFESELQSRFRQAEKEENNAQ